MIEVCLKNREINNSTIVLPHEISHYFIGEIKKIYEGGEIKKIDYKLPDHYIGNSEIPISELDQLFKDYQFLEENLEEIIKIVPLPKMVGCFDGMLYVGYKTPMEFDNYVEFGTGGGKYFDKKDMIYLIGLVKGKILEAKEKNIPLLFSGD